jgi:hypothetical protein
MSGRLSPFSFLLPALFRRDFSGTVENLGPADLQKEPPALLSKAQPKRLDVCNDGTTTNQEWRFKNQTPVASIQVHQSDDSFLAQSFSTRNLRSVPSTIILSEWSRGRAEGS